MLNEHMLNRTKISGAIIFCIFMLSFTKLTHAQETFYFNSKGSYIRVEDKALYKVRVAQNNETTTSLFQSDKNKNKWKKERLISTAEMISKGVYKVYGNGESKDKFQIRAVLDTLNIGYKVKESDENGNVFFIGEVLTLFPLIMHGKCSTFDDAGLCMANLNYLKNKCISETFPFHAFDANINELTKDPEFPGGYINFRRAIAANVKYPIAAQEGGWGGQIYIKFLINEKGEIRQITPARVDKNPLNKAGMQAISSIKEKWQPAEVNGEKVAVWHYAKITFNASPILGIR